jgi:diketogulonate reductase-like aldo/keto reductase
MDIVDIPVIRLKSGNAIPVFGLGTWDLTGQQCIDAVKKALELGYNHIDTAEIYRNHKEVGKGIEGYDRSRLFITSKIWRNEYQHEDVHKACDRALSDMGIDYLDLYLIHWPSSSVPVSETLLAMAELYDNGKIKSVGVSNFSIELLQEAIGVGIPISVNQVELHPHLYQKELLDYCKHKGIVVTAYSPLARGRLLNDEILRKMAEKYNKTTAQVSLKWLLQKGTVVIPKASSENHLKENMNIFEWQLDRSDIERIDNIGINKRVIELDY